MEEIYGIKLLANPVNTYDRNTTVRLIEINRSIDHTH